MQTPKDPDQPNGPPPEGFAPESHTDQASSEHQRPSKRRGPGPGQPPPPILNAPPATAGLLGIILIVFGMVHLLPGNWADILVLRLALIPGLFVEAFDHLDQPLAWLALSTPLTHAFVHQDLMHVLVNGGMLLAFGSAVERRFGLKRFLILCAVTAVAGALTQMVADWGSYIPMIGASGAVSGLMGAVVRTLAADRHRPESRRLAIALMALMLIGNGLFGVLGGSVFGLPGLVAWQAHLGGLAAGFLLTDLWLRQARWRMQ